MSEVFSGELTASRFIKFVTPSIITMLFIGTYNLVDAIFVAYYLGSDALAAINIVFPLANFVYGIGIMFTTGGCAIVSIKLGEGKHQEAREKFTLISLACFLTGALLALLCFAFFKPILVFLGGEPQIFQLCYDYGLPYVMFMPFLMSRVSWEYFIRADGRPGFSLVIAIVGGVSHLILDYLFLGVVGLGIEGAAWATVLGFILSFMVGIVYFFVKPNFLRFVRPRWEPRFLLAACINGSSEMVNEISMGITTILFNLTLLRLVGVDGVAAFTILLYVQFFLISLYLGYIGGASPMLSYNYGSGSHHNNRKIVRYTMLFVSTSSLAIFVIALLFGNQMVSIFERPGSDVYDLAVHGLRLFAFSFLFAGINIFGSGFFTAFNNGKISALIAFSRSLFFIAVFIFILPRFIGLNGVWLTVPCAEFVTLFLFLFFYKKYKKTYQYS